MDEKVIETRTCRQCSARFEITDQDMEFYAKVSPVFGGKKELIPPPTLCPECRQQRRLASRNDRNIYRRTCDLTGNTIISRHRPDMPAVYDALKWFGDDWDPRTYGGDMDFSRPFFPQLHELLMRTPKISRSININNVNSDYINAGGSLKNCYLCFDVDALEDCYYCTRTKFSKNCADCLDSQGCENCYECNVCDDCFGLAFSEHCTSCHESYFLDNCLHCEQCFLCTNLVNQKYHFQNKPYPKEEYLALVEKHLLQYTLDRAPVYAFWSQYPRPCTHTVMTENSSGDALVRTKNTHGSYNIRDGENVRYCTDVFSVENVMDISAFGWNVAMSYEGAVLGVDAHGICFCHEVISAASWCFYSYQCRYSHNLFGCVSLRNKEYCILNKQYTKEEYESLVPRIIAHMRTTGEWGEFMPASMSLFGYNETVAMEYFPLTRKEALVQGFTWSDYEPPLPQVSRTIPANKLPERIKEIPDDVLNWAIVCEVTGKPFKITKQELDFYRKHDFPLPRRHPDQRHLDRLHLQNPRKLFERKCDKCQGNMRTTYAPERPEKVYCEDCYNREVYG